MHEDLSCGARCDATHGLLVCGFGQRSKLPDAETVIFCRIFSGEVSKTFGGGLYTTSKQQPTTKETQMLHFFAKRLRDMQEIKRDERGFTLIELLVVVIIIGILAAIAIPVFLAQRERAYTAELQSDLRNMGAAATSCSADPANDGTFTDCDTVAILADNGYNQSENVVVTDADITADADSFAVDATHANLPGVTGNFDTDTGRVTLTP
jgi:type IV pilus assembly protein PilA